MFDFSEGQHDAMEALDSMVSILRFFHHSWPARSTHSKLAGIYYASSAASKVFCGIAAASVTVRLLAAVVHACVCVCLVCVHCVSRTFVELSGGASRKFTSVVAWRLVNITVFGLL
jgi:hypothetical protein